LKKHGKPYLLDGLNVGLDWGITVFVILLGIVGVLYFTTKLSRTFLFWAAFILTRPLVAVLGDFLDKPLGQGGMALSRYTASGVLACFILICIFCFSHRAARKVINHP
jgi:uncharacterized membrane-anchored protein